MLKKFVLIKSPKIPIFLRLDNPAVKSNRVITELKKFGIKDYLIKLSILVLFLFILILPKQPLAADISIYKKARILLFKIFPFDIFIPSTNPPPTAPTSPPGQIPTNATATPDPRQPQQKSLIGPPLTARLGYNPNNLSTPYSVTINPFLAPRAPDANKKFVAWLKKGNDYLIQLPDLFNVLKNNLPSNEYRLSHSTSQDIYQADTIVITQEDVNLPSGQTAPESQSSIIAGGLFSFTGNSAETPTPDPNATPPVNDKVCSNCVSTTSCLPSQIISDKFCPGIGQVCCGGSASPTGNISPTNVTIPTANQSSPTAIPQNTQPPHSDEIKKIIDTVSIQKITEYLTSLVDDDNTPGADETQTRFYSKDGFITESDYVKNTLIANGLTADFQPFTVNGVSTRNVVATIQGSQYPNQYYVVGAHLDSISQSRDPAPGADDNGSGSVAIMEIARAIKASGITPKYSVDFVLFGAEEIGLVGSNYYANHLGSKTVKGMINVDMIGNRGSTSCVNFYYRAYTGGNIISDLIKKNAADYNLGITLTSRDNSHTSHWPQSDHYSFDKLNIPVATGDECDFSPVYHSTNDKTSYINYDQITATAKAVAGAVATLAF